MSPSSAPSAAPYSAATPATPSAEPSEAPSSAPTYIASIVDGQVFEDKDGDGVYSEGDEYLAGVTVTITDSEGTVHTVMTNASGYYEQEVAGGETIVRIDASTVPAGLEQTAGHSTWAHATAVYVPHGGRASVVDAFSQPSECTESEPASKTVYAIVHGSEDSTFWADWGDGARNGLPVTAELVYIRTNYNAALAAQYVAEACGRADGVVMTVPYAAGYFRNLIVAAINSCMAQRPSLPFTLTNTDTAFNLGLDGDIWDGSRRVWDGYVGSGNFAMGQTCGRLFATKDLDLAITGVGLGEVAPAAVGTGYLCGLEDSPTTTGGTAAEGSVCGFPFSWNGTSYSACTSDSNGGVGWCYTDEAAAEWGNCVCDGAVVDVAVYFKASELRNLGIRRRLEGIVDALGALYNVTEFNYPDQVPAGGHLIALGTEAAADLQERTVTMQCGDDEDRGKLPFYGQTVYSQGVQATGQVFALSVRPPSGALLETFVSQQTAGVTPDESGEYPTIVSPKFEQPFQEPSCPKRIAVIVHADPERDEVGYGDSPDTFWEVWHSGAAAANQDFVMVWSPWGYDYAGQAAAVSQYCETEDAIVVTIPYPEGTAGYTAMDDAINACIDSRPYLPVVTTNTDTYHNPRVLGYVGSENHHIGEVCSYAPYTTDKEAFLGIVAPAFTSVDLESVRTIAYLPEFARANAGLTRRFTGIADRLKEFGGAAPELLYSPADVLARVAALEGAGLSPFVTSLSYQGVLDLQAGGVEVRFSCGDNLGDLPYYGQHVWSQGSVAVTQAVAGARAPWRAAVGNERGYRILYEDGQVVHAVRVRRRSRKVPGAAPSAARRCGDLACARWRAVLHRRRRVPATAPPHGGGCRG